MNDDAAAKAVFLAGLPRGEKGNLAPGHTTWDDLGPQTRDRYRRMAQAAIDSHMADRRFIGTTAMETK